MKGLKNPFSGFIDRQVMQTKQNRMLREDKTLSDLNKELTELKGIYLPTEEDKMKVAQLTQSIRNRENELRNKISTEPVRRIVEDVPVSDTRSDVVFGNKGMPKTTPPKSIETPEFNIEEVEVTAEKKKVEPKPKPKAKPKPKKKIDISSRLGRNQLATLKKRRQRIKDNPDAFRPDYAIEFLPDYLKNEYRSELLQLAETFDAGGKTNFPDLNKDGKVTYADVLKGRGVEEKQTGGQTMISEEIIQEVMADPLTAQLTQFLLGEIDDNTVVTNFVNKYGPEVFQVIRTQVLQSIVPDAQTEGMIEGVGNGGMDDDIDGMIGNRQPVAVSQDEYIVPADVMSMLGDGSSDAGAKKLDMMLDRVRMDKTGTVKQATPIEDEEVLPA